MTYKIVHDKENKNTCAKLPDVLCIHAGFDFFLQCIIFKKRFNLMVLLVYMCVCGIYIYIYFFVFIIMKMHDPNMQTPPQKMYNSGCQFFFVTYSGK